ncbi:hypothetical protein OG898_07455 [Streptomyces sp. NBC_00193]|uniref:DUF6716 putative glycosyltransferase n=1 Tax=Streptomyces sp. NBC_00193 TaxID=2975675 RepID=UPI0022549BA8|nr:DUF6716 putative glycosyltransferase [Streptomyces sp. NBC_00193]MCX5296326.1 hypothetical protein [Streptomyces sp. NBC_00193]
MPASNRAAHPAALRVAVLADSDTRWKWGALTARRLSPEPDSVHLTGYLLRGRATPTARQLGEVGVRADRLTEVTCAGFLAELAAPEREPRDRYDVVVLALVGGAVQAVLHGARALWPEPAARPAFVTGYVGVVYEKLADGLLLRHGADLVLANSRHDAGRFRAVYEGVGADAGAVVETALPFLAPADADGYEPVGSTAHRVVFAVQPSVPDARADRTYLLRRAAEHARLHPGREVLIKLRSRPGEHTTHLEELPYQRLAEQLPGGLPSNCRLVYGNMGEVLDTTDLLVTVSSTAALESLHRGIPTAVLTDLGVRETLGNHHFLGSGCLASWTQLDAGLLPKADPDWLAAQGVGAPATPAGSVTPAAPAASAAPAPGPAADSGGHDPYTAARVRLAELLGGAPLPPVAPYYTQDTAPGYLPGILARHHLGPDGHPLPGAARTGADGSRLRRLLRAHLREAARGAYRHGVQRVAPVIRRLGEL